MIAYRHPYTFAGNAGWPSRTDSGVMFDDTTGLKTVKLRLTRNIHGHCAWVSGRTRRFHRISQCGAVHGFWFAIGTNPTWTYTLPRGLMPGRYVLDVNAVDGFGRRDDARRRGQNTVVFQVR